MIATSVKWGTAADWIGGVLTGMAVLVAALTYWRASVVNRAAAARKVWPVTLRYHYGSDENWADLGVLNGSEEPVFDADLHVLRWDWKEHKKSNRRVMGMHFPLLKPGGESNPQNVGLPPPTAGAGPPPLVLEFTDGRGRRWIRRADHVLTLRRGLRKWWSDW